jgi:hypothetical protein
VRWDTVHQYAKRVYAHHHVTSRRAMFRVLGIPEERSPSPARRPKVAALTAAPAVQTATSPVCSR